jgi:hypothetical protein
MPEISPSVKTINQFLDLANTDNIVRVRDNGTVSVRSSAWNRIISFFSGAKTRIENQRTAEAFKNSLLAVANNHAYSRGKEGYHSKDIFYHFVGLDLGSNIRSEVVQSVLNSGILAEESTGTKPLTGRKIQEVIAHISRSGAQAAATKRQEMFSRVEQGVGLYQEGRAKFLEAGYDRSKLEGINVDTFDIASLKLRGVSTDLEDLILNIRQDLNTLIEDGESSAARQVFNQLKHAGDLYSQACLFNIELNYHQVFNEQVAPLLDRYEKAIVHLDAITLNFANLNTEQIQARDDLIAIGNEIHRAKGALGNISNGLSRYMNKVPLDDDQRNQWDEVVGKFNAVLDKVKNIASNCAQVEIIKTTPYGNIKSKELRNEETHISPTAIITDAELHSIDAEIAKLEEMQKNGGSTATQTKGILRKAVSTEALDQLKTVKKVRVSNVLTLNRDELDGGSEARKSVQVSPDGNADLLELNEPGDNYGFYNEKGEFVSDTFSNLAKNSRSKLSSRMKQSDAVKAARQNEIDRNAELRRKRRIEAMKSAEQFFPGSERFEVMASNATVTLDEFGHYQQDLFKKLCAERIVDLALTTQAEINEEACAKIAQKAFNYVSKLTAEKAQEANKRLEDIRLEGLNLLTSLTGNPIRGVTSETKPVVDALSNYLQKVSADEPTIDILFGASEIGTDDRDTARRILFDLTVRSLSGSAQDLAYLDILATDSPFRQIFLATAAHTNNPENRNNPYLSLASSEVIKSLNNIVRQLSNEVGISTEEFNQLVADPLDLTTDKARFEGFVNGGVAQEALDLSQVKNEMSARELFTGMIPYLQNRAEKIKSIVETNSD